MWVICAVMGSRGSSGSSSEIPRLAIEDLNGDVYMHFLVTLVRQSDHARAQTVSFFSKEGMNRLLAVFMAFVMYATSTCVQLSITYILLVYLLVLPFPRLQCSALKKTTGRFRLNSRCFIIQGLFVFFGKRNLSFQECLRNSFEGSAVSFVLFVFVCVVQLLEMTSFW